ncbi:multifunctional acyl-CoA thioesterase I/protease I/lysophospholipase L1 [Photobacterium carnosum]|uniref:multifunctional acyl-CoA thioesterase I/protease I/lysophospholipase L1 n=1 Tax=Photobacterium carnosum TaxID=2023717 RepID=UPI001E53494B|nr:multifunctional acyl-CoA thioesterase I/protease I/lysophospholipase L1 [Photobacterium carnosum]MCD9538710.1 multifunctional acyl-CoA thioesterase I/protease I/lysophospholipase L1 [Photobacterium carnosum]MCF2163444.1 multifunctional acyl-CoA thioesterase I/protease I/lysophospholipase L1 [Photobacterium carnosum]
MIRILSLLMLLFSSTAFSQTLLVLGDSLSAGYQMPANKSWPVLLPKILDQQSQPTTIINASISGDTSGNGLARLPQLLKQYQPDIVLIELGANDGLRGFAPKILRNNLSQMITLIKEMGSQPLLMQIEIPPNYGKRYNMLFRKIYPELSQSLNIPLLPFFLIDIIVQPQLMMKDGIHPTAEAQPLIAQFMAQQLQPYLNQKSL